MSLNDEQILMKGIYASKVRQAQFTNNLNAYGYYVEPSTTSKPTLVLDLDHILIYQS